MALKAVVDAVEARLAANWTTCPVIGANSQGDAPSDGSAYLVVQYPAANSRQASFGAPGANVWREDGAFRLVVHVPRGSGIATLLTWSETLAALFRGALFDSVQCFAPSSPTIDDRNEAGNYFTASFAVPYRYDLIG